MAIVGDLGEFLLPPFCCGTYFYILFFTSDVEEGEIEFRTLCA